ncbi:hypothetical protein NDU88_011642 [Pleurodeles waltl]|uniref:Uncharacterized protein n=1 Tax=Pleurodeles waltl TaxID=8319 RepID=A0AAV7R3N6_PLEWA|nr:hypothetical protein NDU88_011642 [Pleurodeles waltl]
MGRRSNTVMTLQDSTQIWKEKIRTEIEELQRVMEEEKHHILSSLERQQREILHNIRKNVTELVKQRSSLTASQTEMAGRCQLTDLELLKVRAGAVDLQKKEALFFLHKLSKEVAKKMYS